MWAFVVPGYEKRQDFRVRCAILTSRAASSRIEQGKQTEVVDQE